MVCPEFGKLITEAKLPIPPRFGELSFESVQLVRIFLLEILQRPRVGVLLPSAIMMAIRCHVHAMSQVIGFDRLLIDRSYLVEAICSIDWL